MRRRDLHFNSLRSFEVAARHRSLSKAAAELGVTHSAVSHQIKLLEEQIGAELFTRSSQGVRLTPSGETLLSVLSESFDRITNTLSRLADTAGTASLRVTTTPTFATRWLVPRISAWRSLETGINLHLLPTLDFLDLDGGAADVAIRCGKPPWPGLTSELLRPINMTPVCSPSLLKEDDLEDEHDVLNHELIHADIRGHALGEEWKMWLTAAGVSPAGDLQGLSFHDPSLALQAALDGLGIAMGYLDLIEPVVESGRLVCPFDLVVKHYFSYYFVYPTTRAHEDKIRTFKDWLISELPQSGE